MDRCAITDHGVMYGVVDFYRGLQGGGHPSGDRLRGLRLPGHGRQDQRRPGVQPPDSAVREPARATKTSSRLVSEGFIAGLLLPPARGLLELLEKYHEGLIALSACLSGRSAQAAAATGATTRRAKLAQRYLDIFGRGNFFVEMQDHGHPGAEAGAAAAGPAGAGDGHSAGRSPTTATTCTARTPRRRRF